MAKRLHEPTRAGEGLRLYIDPQEFDRASDQAALAAIQEVEAASDNIRAEIGLCRGFGTLEDFDAKLEKDRWDLLDRLDYYDYDNRRESFNVRDGAWFTPEAVESFCGEEAGNEAALTIDGVNNTDWRHDVDERHSITFRLRGYPKKVSKLRLRYGASEPVREQLQNLDIRISRGLANIDDPVNLREQRLNPVWPVGAGATWVEIVLSSKVVQARYIKLEFDTAHGGNQAQMREIGVWVETRDP